MAPGGEPENPPVRDPPPGEPGGTPPADPQPPPVADPPTAPGSGQVLSAAPEDLSRIEARPRDPIESGPDPGPDRRPKPKRKPKPDQDDEKPPDPPLSEQLAMISLVPRLASIEEIHASVSRSHLMDVTMTGDFNVLGTLGSGDGCCVIGKVSAISVDSATGLEIALSLGSLDLAVMAYQDITCSARSTVTICSTGQPDTIETAEISMTMDWLMNVVLRGSAARVTLGPLQVKAGLSIGLSMSQTTIDHGRSPQAHFEIGEEVLSLAGMAGAFISAGCSIGKARIQATIDYFPVFSGEVHDAADAVVASLGLGVGF